MHELYQTQEELEYIMSCLGDSRNFNKARARIRQWLEKTNLELRQFEDEMDEMAEEHSMKLIEFGGMKN